MSGTTNDCGCEDQAAKPTASVGTGTFALLPQKMRLQFPNGTVVIGPADGMGMPPGTAELDPTEILGTFCKLFPSACGLKPRNPEPGGDDGCYKIIGPDGTTITICPPHKDAA